MFPKENIYYFSGNQLDIIPHISYKNKEFKFKKYNNRILLGRFIQCDTIVWNQKTITNGMSTFEQGRVYFPHYRHIRICTDSEKYK